MRKPALLLFVLLLAGVFSCNLITRPWALHLNNTLVAINDSLYFKGKEYGALVIGAINSKDFSKLKPRRINFEQFIDSCVQRVVRMKDVGGSEELRNCEIELLRIEKNMSERDFVPFENLTSTTGMDEIARLFDTVKKDSKAEAYQLTKFKRLQDEYAKKNGFKLMKNPNEE